MDLKALDTTQASNEGFELQLAHPGSGELLGIFITVLGRDSAAFRTLQTEQNKRRIQRMTKGTGARMSLAAEEMEEEAVELLSACTRAWRQEEKPVDEEDAVSSKDTLTVEGKELPCTRANAADLYRKFTWIREQVDAGVTDRQNFIKR